jgi:hypothetical protein
MTARIHQLLLRNLQEVFGEGEAAKRRAAIKELYTDDCVLYIPPAISLGTMPSISLQVTCAPHILTSPTHPMLLPKPSTMEVA